VPRLELPRPQDPLLQLSFCRDPLARSTWGKFRLHLPSLPDRFWRSAAEFGLTEGRLRVAKYDVAIIGSGARRLCRGDSRRRTRTENHRHRKRSPFLERHLPARRGASPPKFFCTTPMSTNISRTPPNSASKFPGVKMINWTQHPGPQIEDVVTKARQQGIEFLLRKIKIECEAGLGEIRRPREN